MQSVEEKIQQAAAEQYKEPEIKERKKPNPSAVILLPAHPASFGHKFLFQRVLASPGMQSFCRLVIKNSVLDS